MPDSLDADALDRGANPGAAVAAAGLSCLRTIGQGWGLAEPRDIGPLLDLFEGGKVQHAVGRAVPELHAWSRTSVTGESRLREISPLLQGHDALAGTVPE